MRRFQLGVLTWAEEPISSQTSSHSSLSVMVNQKKKSLMVRYDNDREVNEWWCNEFYKLQSTQLSNIHTHTLVPGGWPWRDNGWVISLGTKHEEETFCFYVFVPKLIHPGLALKAHSFQCTSKLGEPEWPVIKGSHSFRDTMTYSLRDAVE